MKKILALLAFVGLFTASCSNDDDDAVTGGETTQSALDKLVADANIQSETVSVDSFTVDEMAEVIFGPVSNDENTESARNKFLKQGHEKEDSINAVEGTNGLAIKYYSRKYYYWSHDENNNSIRLSGVIVYAGWDFFGRHYNDANHIILVCPYTRTCNAECASEAMAKEGSYKGISELQLIGCDDLFIVPDGQGFGISSSYTQPYLNHNLQAQQLYDGMVAGYDKFRNEVGGEMESDWTLRVVGCSQGGGDAMAVHKYLDTNNLSGTWRFEYSYPCVGPYDPAATFKKYMEDGFSTYPCVFPMVIKAMRNAFPDFANKYPEERFFNEKYNTMLKTNMDYHLKVKDLGSADVCGLFFKSLCTTEKDDNAVEPVYDTTCDYIYLKNFLSEEILDTTSQMYQDLMECLEKQNLTTGWTPKTKTYLFCSKNDEIVPYVNSQHAKTFFDTNNVYADVATRSYTHTTACAVWIATKAW